MNPLLLREVILDWEKVDSSYLREIPSLRSLESFTFSSPVTFFVGENGSGKSTLLEAIAVSYGFNPEGGTRNYRFSTHSSHSDLWQAVSLVKGAVPTNGGYFFRGETFYNVATMEEEYRGGRSLRFHEQSHGESFLSLVQNSFSGRGLFLLDEPESSLSPQRQLAFLREISELVKEGAQFIIATHSPIVLAMEGAEIYNFSEDGIRRCEYEETESYQVMKMFLENPKGFLHHLLKE